MTEQTARQLRANQTDAERHLWKWLRTLRDDGYHFRRQAPIGFYVADFVCHRVRLVIEVDGGQHGLADEIRRDDQRTAWLAGQGYQVIRFWNNDVLTNIEGVAQMVQSVLARFPAARKG